MFEDDDGRTYVVVVNHEEQYSIWPDRRRIPDGWRAAGKAGTKESCLEYIEKVWTDMRPLSLRRQMAGQADRPHEAATG
jgi:MbtH protein